MSKWLRTVLRQLGCVYSEGPATNPLLKEIKAFSVRLTSSGKAGCNTYVCLFPFNTAKRSGHHVNFLWRLKKDFEHIMVVLVMPPKYLNSSNVANRFGALRESPPPQHLHTSYPRPQFLWTPWKFSCCLLHVWTNAENISRGGGARALACMRGTEEKQKPSVVLNNVIGCWDGAPLHS